MAERDHLRTLTRSEAEQIRKLSRDIEHGVMSHYALLGIADTARIDQIRQSYLRMAHQWHPDRFRSVDLGPLSDDVSTIFSAVNEAYRVLKRSTSRSGYDARRRKQTREQTREHPARVVSPPPVPTARFADTHDVLRFGVQLGLGKALQRAAVDQLCRRVPEIDHPLLRAGLKMSLPMVGIALSSHLRDADVAATVRSASEGMLLVNTIDTTAQITDALLEQAVPLLSALLGLFGVADDDAQQSARQLVEDLDIAHTMTRAPPAPIKGS
ncbi:MAG: J domain-containing protein [Myxococcota bacterium]